MLSPVGAPISAKSKAIVSKLLVVVVLLFCAGCQPSEPQRAKSPADRATAQTAESKVDSADFPEDKTVAAITRGVDWLLAQQAEDGGWHSQTYGPFKGGAATTALVLYAASRLPDDIRKQHSEAWRRGWKFLEPGVREKGFVVCPDGTMDEPVYATALVLIAARTLKLDIQPALIESMQGFLWRERCGPERSFKPDDPNYGGWDLAGGAGLRGETPGSNVSITRFAVEALGLQITDLRAIGVQAWAQRVQNLPGDGGFFFHPQRDHEGNKAQWADGESREKPRSYGTATCDGVLLLRALCNPSLKDAELQFEPGLNAGFKWLSEHSAVDRVPGFEDAPPELGWQHGLLFYYLMSLSQATRYGDRDFRFERWQAIEKQLLSTQKEDGRWQNESARMREDDPLIATSFALVALSEVAQKSRIDSIFDR